MLVIVCWSLVISLAINATMFLIAFRFKSDKLTDASYAITFITLAVAAYAYSGENAYVGVVASMVLLWALRIGGFLLYRVLHVGKDRRFDAIRDNFWQFGRFWIGQAFTVWVLMLPIILISSNSIGNEKISLIAIAVWLIGFSMEAVADLQKYRFTHNPNNKGKWIDSGIWHYSRHPNYFGEILVWVGVYAYCFNELTLTGRIIGLVSPLLITTLLLFVSGIPLLEKEADKRWGGVRSYQLYKRQTSLIIPLPKRKSNQ